MIVFYARNMVQVVKNCNYPLSWLTVRSLEMNLYFFVPVHILHQSNDNSTTVFHAASLKDHKTYFEALTNDHL